MPSAIPDLIRKNVVASYARGVSDRCRGDQLARLISVIDTVNSVFQMEKVSHLIRDGRLNSDVVVNAFEWQKLIPSNHTQPEIVPSLFPKAYFPVSPIRIGADGTGKLHATAPTYPYPQWAADQADRVCHLYREGVHPKEIYDKLRAERFIYEIESKGDPLGYPGAIFGAFRKSSLFNTFSRSKVSKGPAAHIRERLRQTLLAEGIVETNSAITAEVGLLGKCLWAHSEVKNGLNNPACTFWYDKEMDDMRIVFNRSSFPQEACREAESHDRRMDALADLRNLPTSEREARILELFLEEVHDHPVQRGGAAIGRSFYSGLWLAVTGNLPKEPLEPLLDLHARSFVRQQPFVDEFLPKYRTATSVTFP